MSDAALEIARLRAALAASEGRVETAEARAETAESELAQVRAVVSTSEAMIKHLRLEIARLRREQCGHSSERRARLLDQMELRLEELEAAATEDEVAAEKATKTTPVAGFDRRRPARKPFPEHPPRERVVIEAPTLHLLRLRPHREDGGGWLIVPCHAARMGWAEPAGHGPVRERAFVRHWSEDNGERTASASESPGRAVCPRRRRSQPLDPGRPGRCPHRRTRAPPSADPRPCPGGQAAARGW